MIQAASNSGNSLTEQAQLRMGKLLLNKATYETQVFYNLKLHGRKFLTDTEYCN